MPRLIPPLILIAAAAGLFMLYTNPAYQKVQALQIEATTYDDALTKSQELKKRRDELISRRNTFESEDVAKLEKILPDNVDNIRLVIDINSVAARHGLTLSDVELGTLSDASEARSTGAVGGSGSKVGSVELGFSLTADYESMLAFLADLEHSLRLIDVERIGFEVGETGGGTHDYNFSIRTFWLH